MCSATVMNSIVATALQLSVYSDTTEHAENLAFALKSLPDLFKQNGKYTAVTSHAAQSQYWLLFHSDPI